MKTASKSAILCAATFSVMFAGGLQKASANMSTTDTFNSDVQTYVVSSSATATMYPTAEDNTNFYGKGAMMISAPVTAAGTAYASVTRAMDSLFSFNTSSYVTQFNTLYGVNNWNVTSATILLSTNWTGQGIQPSNDDFNAVSSGAFNLNVLGGATANPNLKTVTWNTLQSALSTGTTQSSVGTFNWDATQTLAANGYVQDSYSLTTNGSLLAAVQSGEVTLLGTAADSQVGYVFNTANRIPPAITLTVAEDVATTPIPPSLVLFGSGLLGLVGLGRKRENGSSLA